MRFLIPTFAALLFAPITPAAEPKPAVRTAVERGLRSLADDGLTWKENRKCASCHHTPMTLWAFHEAKRYGFAVDEKVLADLTAWALDKNDPAQIHPKQPEPKEPPKEAPKVTVNLAAVLMALSLEAGEPKDEAAKDRLHAFLKLVVATQAKDGSWQAAFEWQPILASPDVITTQALLALSHPSAPDLGADGKAARENGLKWLATAKSSDETETSAMRLLLANRLGRATEADAFAKQLLARQNADGGWGETKALPSDALTTGQALYALADAGRKPDDAAVQKGVAFLLKSQNEFGAWEMTSRNSGNTGKPAKNLTVISYAGTAWATLGLIRTAPPAKP